MQNRLAVAILLILITGCAGTMPWDIERNKNNLMKIEVGMSKKEVIDIMGMPRDREVYATPDGSTIEFLIYLTKYTDSGPIPDRDTTPICFMNGKITGWGRNFYVQQQQRYQLEMISR